VSTKTLAVAQLFHRSRSRSPVTGAAKLTHVKRSATRHPRAELRPPPDGRAFDL